jgi:hypothetical protein
MSGSFYIRSFGRCPHRIAFRLLTEDVKICRQRQTESITHFMNWELE